MGSEVPSTVLFSEGRSPEENSTVCGRNRRHIDSTGASNKGMISLFYIPLQDIQKSFSYFHLFCVDHFHFHFEVHRPVMQ